MLADAVRDVRGKGGGAVHDVARSLREVREKVGREGGRTRRCIGSPPRCLSAGRKIRALGEEEPLGPWVIERQWAG